MLNDSLNRSKRNVTHRSVQTFKGVGSGEYRLEFQISTLERPFTGTDHAVLGFGRGRRRARYPTNRAPFPCAHVFLRLPFCAFKVLKTAGGGYRRGGYLRVLRKSGQCIGIGEVC